MTDPTPTGLPRLHLLPDVAEQLGISLRVLRARARERKFEHVLIGRERYLTDQQLTDLIAGSTVTTERRDALAEVAERQRRRRARKQPSAQRPAA